MPTQGTIYRILIASPSDCAKERASIQEVIYSWNSAHSLHTNVILEPVMWETHVIPAIGDRPQELINRQLVDYCDFLIGAFWTRIGTETGGHVSGTAEEINEMRTKGKNVFLYFSSAPVALDSVDPDQYASLIKYKKELRGEGITFEYSDIVQFREMLHKHLSSLMASICNDQSVGGGENNDNEIELFKSQFSIFLRRFESEWISERDSNPTNIDEGKYILQAGLSELMDFRSYIESDPDDKIIPVIEDCAKSLRELGRHRLTLDGGRTFDEFWKKGSEAIGVLQVIPALL